MLRSVWSLCELLDCGSRRPRGSGGLNMRRTCNSAQHDGERACQKQCGQWKLFHQVFHGHPPGDVPFVLRTHPVGFLARVFCENRRTVDYPEVRQPDCGSSRYESRERRCGRAQALRGARQPKSGRDLVPGTALIPDPDLCLSRSVGVCVATRGSGLQPRHKACIFIGPLGPEVTEPGYHTHSWPPLGARVACKVSAVPGYCCFQVWPPSSVTNCRRPAMTVACSASLAAMPVQSMSPAGEATRCQCSPSIVRRTTPARPAIHATWSDGAEPASRSLVTPLVCSTQFWAWSTERATRPPGPIRQRTFPPGEAKVSGGGATAPATPPTIPRVGESLHRSLLRCCRRSATRWSGSRCCLPRGRYHRSGRRRRCAQLAGRLRFRRVCRRSSGSPRPFLRSRSPGRTCGCGSGGWWNRRRVRSLLALLCLGLRLQLGFWLCQWRRF